MHPRRSIAIIGAGYSGSLLALHLLKAGPPGLRISLIERSPMFGRGLAYGTHNPRHLLNVRVANMSAWPDQPGHLVAWLAAGGADPVPEFISRGTYGRYIGSLLQAAVGQPDGAQRLLLEQDEAVQVRLVGGGCRVILAMGRTLEADAVALATGHLPPTVPPGVGLETLGPASYSPDPWNAKALEGLSPDARILLLGSGLTMVDVALALDAAGHRGPVLAVSRRGLAPKRHLGAPAAFAGPPADGDIALSGRLYAFRRRAEAIGWREAIDELRPSLQAIWRRTSLNARRRFLRHLRPWWDVHRHRMAPAVADWIDAQRRDGRLAIGAGRILSVAEAEDGVCVRWRRRGQAGEEVVRVQRIINCTGPGVDISRTSDPLLRSLIGLGLARTDSLRLGLDVDEDGRLIGAGGRPSGPLYAVGPVTRGAFWEIVAVPDIRNQVAQVAEHIAGQLVVTAA